MPSDLFSNWTASESPTPEAAAYAASRRRLVLWMKRLFAVFAVVGIVGIGLMAYYNTVDNRFRLDFSHYEGSDTLPPVMVNPRFQGMDAEGRPFAVTAALATQEDTDQVVLQSLQADITMDDGTWVTISSKHGQLELETRMLYLLGEVQFYHDAGYSFVTNRVVINMKTGIVNGPEPVSGQGQMGSLQADGFQISQEKDHIRFGKNVRLTLYPAES